MVTVGSCRIFPRMAEQVPAVCDVLDAIERRNWTRLQRLLHPDIHWTTAVEEQLHGSHQGAAPSVTRLRDRRDAEPLTDNTCGGPRDPGMTRNCDRRSRGRRNPHIVPFAMPPDRGAVAAQVGFQVPATDHLRAALIAVTLLHRLVRHK
jgi:hypothetical protein